jgi:putative flippase GtrA
VPQWLAFQLPVFALVGVANTLVDAGLFAVLVAWFHIAGGAGALLASATAFVGGAAHSYLWNSRVTFAAGGRRSLRRYAAVVGTSLAVSSLTFAVLQALGPGDMSGLTMAKAGALVTTGGWNFVLMRRWAFG